MKPRTLAILGTLTLAAAGLAAWQLSRQQSQVDDAGARGPLFPELHDKVNDVTSVKVTRGTTSFTVALKGDGTWGITERGGFAAKFETVKGAIVGIAGLSIQEPRTSNAANYDKIGVEDATKEGATSTLVALSDAAGKPMASVILGKPKTATGFNAPPDFYARRDGEAQSWLVRPVRGSERLDIRSDPMEWLDRSIVQIGRDRVRGVTITHASDGERVDILKDKKEDANFKLAEIPAGRELKFPTSCDAVAGALASLTLDDVKPASEVSFEVAAGAAPLEVSTAEYRTWDGLVLVVRSAKVGDKTWAKFEARYEEPPPPAEPEPEPSPVEPDNPDSQAAKPEPAKPDPAEAEKVKKEAADLQARLSEWTYALADWQSRNFATRAADLLKPLPGEEAPPPPMPGGIQPLVPPEGVPSQVGPMGPTPPPLPPPP